MEREEVAPGVRRLVGCEQRVPVLVGLEDAARVVDLDVVVLGLALAVALVALDGVLGRVGHAGALVGRRVVVVLLEHLDRDRDVRARQHVPRQAPVELQHAVIGVEDGVAATIRPVRGRHVEGHGRERGHRARRPRFWAELHGDRRDVRVVADRVAADRPAERDAIAGRPRAAQLRPHADLLTDVLGRAAAQRPVARVLRRRAVLECYAGERARSCARRRRGGRGEPSGERCDDDPAMHFDSLR